MHRFAQLFTDQLLNRPQMIAPLAGATVVQFLMPHADFDMRGLASSQTGAGNHRSYQVASGMAVIPVVGKLVHRGRQMDSESGLTSYQALGDMISAALADPGVQKVLLDIDSPGGEGAGCLDFASWLAAQRGSKPIWASVNQQACSAAYAIASGADKVLIGRDAVAGSIGVVTYHTDASAALAQKGIKVTPLFAGARKVDGAPMLPLSDDVRLSIQGEIDDLYDRFCSVVAANRGMSVDAVRATQAATLTGPKAIAAGLADQIATHEDAIMELASMQTQSAAIGSQMSAAARPRMGSESPAPAETQPGTQGEPNKVANPEPQKPADPSAPQPGVPGALPSDHQHGKPTPQSSPGYGDAAAVAQACQQAGFPELTAALLTQGASMAAVTQRLAVAKEVVEMCAAAGRSGMSASLVKHGVSLEAARDMVFASRADADALLPTGTGHDAATASAAAGPQPIDGRKAMAAFNSAREPGRKVA